MKEWCLLGVEKKYVKAKEELWKLNISTCKNIIFKKSSKKTTKSFKIS